MYFKRIDTNAEMFKFEKKEPHCILLHTENPQTREEKKFAIVKGTLDTIF